MAEARTSPGAWRWSAALMLAGLLLGLLLGPLGLGLVLPQTYEHWFVGGAEAAPALERHALETEEQVERMQAIGVTAIAVRELRDRRAAEAAPLHEQVNLSREAHLQGLRAAQQAVTVTLALVAAMVAMGLGRRSTVVLAAGVGLWIILPLARPAVLEPASVALTLVLLAVAVAVAAAGPRRPTIGQ